MGAPGIEVFTSLFWGPWGAATSAGMGRCLIHWLHLDSIPTEASVTGAVSLIYYNNTWAPGTRWSSHVDRRGWCCWDLGDRPSERLSVWGEGRKVQGKLGGNTKIGSDVSGQRGWGGRSKQTSRDVMRESLWRQGCPGTDWQLQRGGELRGEGALLLPHVLIIFQSLGLN